MSTRIYFIRDKNKEDETLSFLLSLHCFREWDRTSITKEKSHILFSSKEKDKGGGEGEKNVDVSLPLFLLGKRRLPIS